MALSQGDANVAATHTKALPEALIHKIRALPLGRIAEVENFVDFIGHREQERIPSRATAATSAPAFAAVWDNPERRLRCPLSSATSSLELR